MTTFNASFQEIEPRELVRHLLRETEQSNRDNVDAEVLLSYLKLDYLSFDFNRELPADVKQSGSEGVPRALLSFGDRLIATNDSLDEKQARFSVLHEIGHYVLPNHEHALYVCDEQGLSFSTRITLEREANAFAADLLFLGDRFSVEANSKPISALTVKELATKYRASFESTARRLVEKSFRPCMLVVFKEERQSNSLRNSGDSTWAVRYCIASPTFKNKHFERVAGSAPPEAVVAVTRPGRDLADSFICDMEITERSSETAAAFQAEFFSNTYNIFCLLTPAP